jgi:hypothetical protein
MKFKITETVDALGEAVVVWHSDYVSQQKEVGAMSYDAFSFLLKRGWAMSPYGMVLYRYHLHRRKIPWSAHLFNPTTSIGKRSHPIGRDKYCKYGT